MLIHHYMYMYFTRLAIHSTCVTASFRSIQGRLLYAYSQTRRVDNTVTCTICNTRITSLDAACTYICMYMYLMYYALSLYRGLCTCTYIHCIYTCTVMCVCVQVSKLKVVNTHLCTWHIRSDTENCEGWLSPGHSSGGRALSQRPLVQSRVAAGFSQFSKILPSLTSCTRVC